MRMALLGVLVAQIAAPAPRPGHAVVTSAPAAMSAEAGKTLELFVDVAPKPGIHVYAPGAKDYLAVSLKLNPQAEAKAGKVAFPPSEVMFFEALNEHVPVFQKPFRITQAVTLDRAAKPGSTVTVSGTLNYQACDDKTCYPPEASPVSWRVTVK
jgi:Disulphide bond corrector protein DsbC